jgi:hypothetical protein
MNRLTVVIVIAIAAFCSAHQAWAQGAVNSAATSDCEKRGEPKIGMTAPQAMETCWGKPVRTVTRVTHDSFEEQLIYADGRVLKFKNGSLIAILEKQ